MKGIFQTALAVGLASVIVSVGAHAAGVLAVDVQRNINQQQRIEQGVRSGALTSREASRLERGQAQVAVHEARAASNGRIGIIEQRHIQRSEARQSRRIFRAKHNVTVAL